MRTQTEPPPHRWHRATRTPDLPEYPLHYTSRYARIETVGIPHRRVGATRLRWGEAITLRGKHIDLGRQR